MWGAPRGVLTHAHAQRERGGEGSHVGRTVVAWAGAVGGGAPCGSTRWWRQVPKAGGEQKFDTTGAGAGCAPGRGGVLAVGARGGWGFWWGRSFLWVRGVVLGAWHFPPWWWAWVGGNDFPR